jgi:hypothetical protein
MTAKIATPKKTMTAQTARPAGQARPERRLSADLPSMEEPTLSEMLHDPIMQRLMTSDGITRSQLLTLVAAARSRLQSDGYVE